MPYETNVIRFVEDATTDPLASNISSYLDVYTAVGDPNATFGWVDIDFSQSAYPDTSGVMFDGLPVYGFALKVRQPNGAPHQIGQMMNHGYGYKAVTP
ncbi:hypothetical protein CKO36_01860 [Rhabdochromatium marinum]|nr:hypothetical protein [Rhabdochromatium marinum]